MLTLPIKRMWFDMIASGEKKEEYREIKEYYDSRLLNAFGAICVGDEVLHNALPEADRVEWPVPVIFRNGYSKAAPQVKAMCTLSIGTGKPEWGAELGKKYYILHIKEIEKGLEKDEINRCRQADRLGK